MLIRRNCSNLSPLKIKIFEYILNNDISTATLIYKNLDLKSLTSVIKILSELKKDGFIIDKKIGNKKFLIPLKPF
jgi:predicted transcriptional regulator